MFPRNTLNKGKAGYAVSVWTNGIILPDGKRLLIINKSKVFYSSWHLIDQARILKNYPDYCKNIF